MTGKNFAAFSSGIAAALIAGATAWITLRTDVQARMTEPQVRQIIDDKTTDKFFEVFRRFDKLEGKMDKLEEAINQQNRKHY